MRSTWAPAFTASRPPSRYYFDKSVQELTLAEAALLAGIGRRTPGLHSPYRDPEAARRRRNTVSAPHGGAGHDHPRRSPGGPPGTRRGAPIAAGSQPGADFVNYVMRSAVWSWTASTSTPFTRAAFTSTRRWIWTCSGPPQEAVQQAFAQSSGLLARATVTEPMACEQPQVALIALDPRNGHYQGHDRRPGQRPVQPGGPGRAPARARRSSRLFTPPPRHGLTPATVLVDEPFEWVDPSTGEVWRPRNFTGRFSGEMTLREALEQSINIIAVKLLADHVTPRQVIDYARRMGISTLVTEGPPPRRGAGPGPRRHHQRRAGPSTWPRPTAFCQPGVRSTPMAITRVVAADGTVLYDFSPEQEVVLSEVTSYIVTDMLPRRHRARHRPAGQHRAPGGRQDGHHRQQPRRVVRRLHAGAGRGRLDRQRSALPMVVGGTPVGSGEAAEIWGNFMRAALADTPPSDFRKPASGLVEDVLIDVKTGLLANATCLMIPRTEMRREIFAAGTEPKELSPRCHNPFWTPDARRPLRETDFRPLLPGL